MVIWGRLATAAATAATLLGIATGSAFAATINVDVTADNLTNDEQCTLREAVTTANTNTPVNGVSAGDADCEVGQSFALDTIVLGSSTYTLALSGSAENSNATGDLDLQVGGQGDLQIDGTGPSTTEIDGADLDRVIDVVSGNTTVTLSDLRVDNGTAPSGEPGGAIRNSGNNMTLTNVSVTNSSSDSSAGGIFYSTSLGTLSLTNSTVSGNAVSSSASGLAGTIGAGIRIGTGTLSLTGSTVSNNTVTKSGTGIGAGVSGAGIAAQNATVTATDSTISGNTVNVSGNALDFPGGGGIAATDTNVTFTRSTVSGNITGGGNTASAGGVDFVDTGVNNTLAIENSTFSGNAASSAGSHGAAIEISQGITKIANATFTNNTSVSGRSIYYQQQVALTSSVTVRGTIFSEDSTNECASPSGDLTSAGYNLDRGTSCGLASTGDQQSTTPTLATLASNGGSTQTHALSGNGVDDIPAASCFDTSGTTLFSTDQRGVARPQGTDCDIGAYELGPTCSGQPSTIIGTGSGETIDGTSGADVIAAGGGADTVNSGDGADVICGGDGNDLIRTGTGNDSDIAFGEGDTDTISFSDLNAGLTTATILDLPNGSASGSDAGSDTLNGFENLIGTPFNDQNAGAAGLIGNFGPNTIDGRAGNDVVIGSGGDDTLLGDVGTDTASWISLSADAVTVNLTNGTASSASHGSDTLSSFENAVGGSQADTLIGDNSANNLNGFSGDDTLDGRSNDDFYTGGPGSDTASFSGIAGPVTASLSVGALTASGQGTDGGNTIENLTGSPDGDTLTGDGLANVINGDAGNDTLADGVTTTANADSFIGGPGTDTVSYAARVSSSANVTVDLNGTVNNAGEAGENDDVGTDVEGATGGAGQDQLIGDENANALSGGDNTDTLDGRGAGDTMDGGSGSDVATYANAAGPVTVDLNSGASGAQGADSLTSLENAAGSSAGDTLIGTEFGNVLTSGDGNDTLDGRGGDDVLAGGNDADTASFAGLSQAVTATLTAGMLSATGQADASDTGSSIENLTGSDLGDTLTGDDLDNVITGGLGADNILANAGADTLLIRDSIGDTADCGSDAVVDTVTADEQGTDTLTNCSGDTIDFATAPPPSGGGSTPPTTTPNPLCATLRAKLKKAKKAHNAPLIRKLKRKLRRLGC